MQGLVPSSVPSSIIFSWSVGGHQTFKVLRCEAELLKGMGQVVEVQNYLCVKDKNAMKSSKLGKQS